MNFGSELVSKRSTFMFLAYKLLTKWCFLFGWRKKFALVLTDFCRHLLHGNRFRDYKNKALHEPKCEQEPEKIHTTLNSFQHM